MSRLAVVAFCAFAGGAVVGCGNLLGFGDDDPVPDDAAISDAATGDATMLGDGFGEGATGESDGAPPPKRVFVTRGQFRGDFGGRAQGDARCASAAAAANRTGTFIAYLAEEDGGHPSLRFPADHTWALLDPDASVAFSRSPARQVSPAAPIMIDEHGEQVPIDAGGKFVWTGVVTPPSYPYEQTCDGWTVAGTAFAGYGDVTSTTGTWQGQGATASECLQQYRLYCFELLPSGGCSAPSKHVYSCFKQMFQTHVRGIPESPADAADRIVVATLRTIENHGLDALTVRTIAREAGVNIAAINYYFRSKDDLVALVLERALDRALADPLAEFDRLAGAGKDARVALAGAVEAALAAAVQFPRTVVAQLHGPVVMQDYRRDVVVRMNALLDRLFSRLKKRLVGRGEVRKRATLAQLWSAVTMASLAPMLLRPFSRFDLRDAKQRRVWIDALVMNALVEAPKARRRSRGRARTRSSGRRGR